MSAEASPLEFLRHSAALLSTRIREADPNLPDPETLHRELEAVVRMIEAALADEDPASVPEEPPSLLALRFLDLLRAGILREGTDGPGPALPSDSELVTLMRAFEVVRAKLESEGPNRLGAPVLDPWARRLLREMAHTLGSSMGPMVMLTEVLASGESGPVNEVQRNHLRILYRAALAAGSMSVDLLRLTGPFEEPDEAVSESFTVADLLEDVRAVLGPLLAERGIEAEIGPSGEDRDAQARVGRPFALRRALVSLSLASITDASGGTFTLTTSEDGDRVAFSLAREIPQAEHEEAGASGPVFRERSGGRGWHIHPPAVTLASARRLIEALGGELERSGASPSDARFSFSLVLPRVSGL